MGLRLRKARPSDEELLLMWRISDESADWWRGKPVNSVIHGKWFRDRLGNKAVRIWIAEDDFVPVGMARLDSNGELAFSVDKRFRGRGYGTWIVQEAVRLAHEDGWTRVKACADRTNEAGIRTMIKAGFKVRDDVAFLRWPE